MSFNHRVKNELARREMEEECCLKAELTALVHLNGSLQVRQGNLALMVTTESPAVARRIFLLIKKIFNTNSEILSRKKNRFKKNTDYLVRVGQGTRVKEILEGLQVATLKPEWSFNRQLNPGAYGLQHCCRAYLRGAFLARGYLNYPENTYHLEINTDYETRVKELQGLLNSFNIQGSVTKRKNCFMVYVKDGPGVAEFLNITGAHQALFEFENTRIIKDMRNKINRLVNCETANLNKTVNAALEQLESIKILDRVVGLSNLPQSLRQIAETRIRHPEANLQELGHLVNPPISKSGVNHRLRKINKMAGEILKNQKSY